ncbi:MAG TPA: valine--tRNA ligase [bacterium]|nr:valine--tRNA ligase [bacterium]
MEQEMNLPSAYEPKDVEAKWYPLWEASGDFRAEDRSSKPAFCMVMPPPNVTGSLHMGHALNDTLQDLIARFKRMRGFNVLWLPGVDHAGIATQNVVERVLKKEGKSRHDLGREAFIRKVWEWKEKYGATINQQIRKMGASCDWSRGRFTMDEGLSKAVQQVFISLYNEKLIVQDYYLINWCPHCRTALSDIEVEHKPVHGNFYHLRYPFAHDPSQGLEVATTRPETLLGDTAVAVHPEDGRYAGLEGKSVLLPLLGRKIPVLKDAYVDKEFGTGVVKITPAHDFNDFQVGNRHKLERINILNPDGTLNENAGPYQGMDRFAARKKIVADLEAGGFLLKVEPHEHNVGHCYRCGTVVEPYYSKQWFVRMKPLAEKALQAVAEGKTKFVPEMWRGEYERWLSNIQDWCISRQIWWGHRIPVYNCTSCGNQVAAAETPGPCAKCKASAWEQDPDVLDTWFSSGLWPFSTLGWPDPMAQDLKTFYPTSVLVTSWDILFFWVARMMMMGLKFMGDVPFREVYIYSLVADEDGKKMSKSKGNVVDPLEIIEKHGCDALRFTLTSIETKQRYVALTPQKLESSRNFVNKLYNATRFVLLGLSDGTALKPLTPSDHGSLRLEDRWILSRLSKVTAEVTQDYERYRVAELSATLYRFVWNEFCDWYLESVKPRLYALAGSPEKTLAASMVVTVLEGILRLLHPVTPFVTEELWHKLPGRSESIMRSPWPDPKDYPVDEKALEEFAFLQEVVTGIRTSRSELNVPPSAQVKVSYQGAALAFSAGSAQESLLKPLGRVQDYGPAKERPVKTALVVVKGGELYLHLEGLIDLKAEAAKQVKEREKLAKYVQTIEGKLRNESFVKNAPVELVDAEKAKLRETQEKIARIENNLKFLEN